VQAQDEYLKEGMESCLMILRYENKKKFSKRFGNMMVVAKKVHEQMLEANVGADMVEVGAIQAPDIVRDELTRAARMAEESKKRAKPFSEHVKGLGEWALAREQKKQAEVKDKMAMDASEESVSSSSPVSRAPARPRSGRKKPLQMSKVKDKETGSEKEDKEQKGTDMGVFAFKKFEIKESTIPGAGRGLFLKEKAKHGEPIARYSGKLMSRAEAMASKSKYIVQVSKDKFLCADGEEEWEGKMANCARKAKRVCNARFQANGKINYCEVSNRYWIKIYAVGEIEAGDEVLPDYNKEFWQDEDGTSVEASLPTPTSNYKTEEEGNSESSWEPPQDKQKIRKEKKGDGVSKALQFSGPEDSSAAMGEQTTKREGPLRRSSRLKQERKKLQEEENKKRQEEQLKTQRAQNGSDGKKQNKHEDNKKHTMEEGEDEVEQTEEERQDEGEEEVQDDEDEQRGKGPVKSLRKTLMNGRRIYAVSVGRCVGIFRSVIRMQSAVLRYPRGEHSRFASEREAEAFLKERGVAKPRKFWQEGYSSGELLQNPELAVGCDVAFPVGLGIRASHGIVLDHAFQDDQWMWRVQMDHGQIDRMSEWPLVCGLAEAEKRNEWRAGAEASTNAMKTNSKKVGQRQKFIAIRGTDNDGVVEDVFSATKRLKGPMAEMQEFENRKEAEEWIQEKSHEQEDTFFAIRGGLEDGIVMSMQEVFPRMRGEDAQYEVFNTRKEAEKWIDEWKFFAVRFRQGQCSVVPKMDILSVTKGRRGVRIVGPMSKTEADTQVISWEGQQRVEEEEESMRSKSQPVVDLESMYVRMYCKDEGWKRMWKNM